MALDTLDKMAAVDLTLNISPDVMMCAVVNK